MNAGPKIGVVIIGRNEGAHLPRALASVSGSVAHVVYVDSGSSDNSLDLAHAAGAGVVELDPGEPFTAARARNAGLAALMDNSPVDYVQFIDGDCELVAGWIETAVAFLDANPETVVVCGRRRERHPEASVYNRLCDREWDTPVGQTRACGGDALMRVAPLAAVGGFNPNLIAGEEPELCLRLRAAGGQVWRLDHDMTLHDANMVRFGQWWQRTRRAGYTYAQGLAMHGRTPERHGVRPTIRAVFWGAALPLVLLVMAGFNPWAWALWLIYPAQIIRLTLRDGWEQALFLTLGKFPEMLGVLEYVWRRLSGQKQTLIEYK